MKVLVKLINIIVALSFILPIIAGVMGIIYVIFNN
jgi:hypothetical protein